MRKGKLKLSQLYTFLFIPQNLTRKTAIKNFQQEGIFRVVDKKEKSWPSFDAIGNRAKFPTKQHTHTHAHRLLSSCDNLTPAKIWVVPR